MNISRLSRLIPYALRRWYGFEPLDLERVRALEAGLHSVDRKLSIHIAQATFGTGTADRIIDVANAASRVDALSKEWNDAVRLNIGGARWIEIGGFLIPISEWLAAASTVSRNLRELAEVVRERPAPFASAPASNLDPQTRLAGSWLRPLYDETYPGKPFEMAPGRTRTNAIQREIPERWGPGPLFIAMATSTLAGVAYDNGEAIKKARRSAQGARGDS